MGNPCESRYFAFVLLMLLVTPCPSGSQIIKNKTLTIGGIFPMSGSWAGGEGCLPAVQMALSDVNNQTDILPEYKLEMDSDDSQCKPGLGTKVLYKLLYNKPTKLLVLCGCSIVSTFVAQAAKMWKLVVLSYGGSSPALSNRERFPTFFRTHPSGTLHNPIRLKVFKKFNWKRISTIQETQELFTSTIEDLEKRVKREGMDIVVRQSFLTDPTNAVRNLRRQDARIIVGVFYEDMARRVFCQTAQQFTERLDKMLNTSDTSLITGYPEAPLAYDAVWAMAFAFHKAAAKLGERGMQLEDFDYNNEEITDAIYSAMNSTKFLGISGNVAFTAKGDRIAWTQVEQFISKSHSRLD
ncbi:gamma-aminobutyric acid (GABA) B receptor, 1 [Elysia marginata]|uniref:Gamma-aminobutyric acid (GABA) B receptor, 1 n=1 Tax=Elysia marginata TaxID=1093978 RepID=A0AAV4HZX9_9GAST|nr:gamma-aminobutyric acid (GABA) B receptor, 1 [Elysia marginata]